MGNPRVKIDSVYAFGFKENKREEVKIEEGIYYTQVYFTEFLTELF